MTMTADQIDWREWMGRTDVSHDTIHRTPLKALAATLDRESAPQSEGEPIPPGWHWLYFLPLHQQSAVGPDGHPRRGGFLPPVSLPRRMWAGSRIEFLSPLLVGQRIWRVSRIRDVRMKEGRTGPLLFVKVEHEISADGKLAIREWQDIVYRDMQQTSAVGQSHALMGERPDWVRDVVPDEVLLFRYSALTFNGHRIHYDRSYATEVERYPGLVVHGPLIATLLLDLFQRHMPDAQLADFSFRAVRPLFDNDPFQVCGRQNEDHSLTLWARDPEGHVAMEARATLA